MMLEMLRINSYTRKLLETRFLQTHSCAYYYGFTISIAWSSYASGPLPQGPMELVLAIIITMLLLWIMHSTLLYIFKSCSILHKQCYSEQFHE